MNNIEVKTLTGRTIVLQTDNVEIKNLQIKRELMFGEFNIEKHMEKLKKLFVALIVYHNLNSNDPQILANYKLFRKIDKSMREAFRVFKLIKLYSHSDAQKSELSKLLNATNVEHAQCTYTFKEWVYYYDEYKLILNASYIEKPKKLDTKLIGKKMQKIAEKNAKCQKHVGDCCNEIEATTANIEKEMVKCQKILHDRRNEEAASCEKYQNLMKQTKALKAAFAKMVVYRNNNIKDEVVLRNDQYFKKIYNIITKVTKQNHDMIEACMSVAAVTIVCISSLRRHLLEISAIHTYCTYINAEWHDYLSTFQSVRAGLN